MSKFIIRKAHLEDMDFFLSHAKNEGWNPGFHDAIPFYTTDPHGFFIGQLDEKAIGCISTVAYNTNYGFLGFYIVIPQYRKQGWGIQLWNHGMHYLGQRSIGLDGVIAQQENYKKSNFKLYYRNIRFEGSISNSNSSSLIDLDQIPFDTLMNYDVPIFGIPRPNFLRHWINMPNAHALGKMDKNRLLGYGVIRSCIKGYKIGPLFADHFEVAKELYHGLCATVHQGPVYLDIPEINEPAMLLAKTEKLQKVFETARMYTSPPPPQDLKKIFGVTSFELG
ncbi:MAG: GNAT family N-acetyltransferase [Parachlamydia sp.]|nr:MAG: GNAT family N-acetyltransferase [Parachlamydia sp.]